MQYVMKPRNSFNSLLWLSRPHARSLVHIPCPEMSSLTYLKQLYTFYKGQKRKVVPVLI
jgi:hypothetical protein